jgi:WD40 repeat protein
MCSQPGHDAPVYALQMIPNTNWCVSASWDGTLKVWELATGKAVATLAGHSGGITALAVAANGRRAASGARDHMLKVWDLEALAEERSLVGHSGAITALAISSDGRWAVSGADDGVLIVWDLDSGQRVADFRAESAIWTCSVSTDGRTIVAAESGGKMYFLEVKR